MRQFKRWENNLEKEPVRPEEVNHTVFKIEYKVTERVEKQIETQAYVTKHMVSKDCLKRATMKPFGVGTSFEDLKTNSVISTVQRENVWHPYYELNHEEMDFKEKMIAAQQEKHMANLGGDELSKLKNQLTNFDQSVQKSDQDQKRAELGLDQKPKATFNLKEKLKKLAEQQAEEDNKQVVDPLTVKVRKIYKDVTEKELEEMMSAFGEVTRTKIPTDEDGQYKGLAFVTFKRAEDCTKVIENGYIQYEFTELPCERAMMSNAKAREMAERRERGERVFRGGDREGGRGGFRGGRDRGDGERYERRPRDEDPLRRNMMQR